MHGPIAGPYIKRVDAKPLRKRVAREGGATRVRANQPNRAADGENAVTFPLTLHGAGVDGRWDLSVPERDQPDGRAAVSGQLHDSGLVAADLFDIARKEVGRLVYGCVLIVANDDLRRVLERRQNDVAADWRAGF